VHLRLCESCGHVGCCDDSKNKLATEHFYAITHPVIRSLEPGEDWRFDETPVNNARSLSLRRVFFITSRSRALFSPSRGGACHNIRPARSRDNKSRTRLRGCARSLF
jgi:hypothetical protein